MGSEERLDRDIRALRSILKKFTEYPEEQQVVLALNLEALHKKALRELLYRMDLNDETS